MEHTKEMTFGEADKIIKDFGITCGASEVFGNARVIAKHNEVNRELVEACRAMKEFIGDAVRFINDGNPPIPDTEQVEISEKYQMLFRLIDKAEGGGTPWQTRA